MRKGLSGAPKGYKKLGKYYLISYIEINPLYGKKRRIHSIYC